jgi:hypothetical protein
MAITIRREPTSFDPVCNPIEWVFESDETAQPNFSFIIELYIDGSLHSTHEVYTESGNVGKFNAQSILRSAILNNQFTRVDLDIDTLVNYEVYINVYEKYGTPPVTDLGSVEESGHGYFINGAFRQSKWIDWDYQDYSIGPGGKTNLFLTDFPRNRKDMLSVTESKFLSIINADDTACDADVVLYDITGSVVASATWNTGLWKVPMLQIGPDVLIPATSLTSANFSNTYKYTVKITRLTAPIKTSETYTLYMDHGCDRYTRRRLHWLNKYGAWDSFTFTLVSDDSSDVTINNYQRDSGIWDGTYHPYLLRTGSQMTMSKYSTDKLVLNSDWIHEDVQQWLVRELYESPRVYLQLQDNTTVGAYLVYEPVNVTNANYLLKQRKKAGLIQEQVLITRTYTRVSQLG